jgi:hypothetical protein
MTRLGERLRAAGRRDPVLFRARALLGAALVGVVLHLLFGDDPWTGGIAERLADGHPLRPLDYARTYGWWTALVNGVGLAVLLATARRWRGPETVPRSAALRARGGPWRAFAFGVAAAIAASALLGAPRLTQSLWDDELYQLTHSVDGNYVRDASGEVAFHGVEWRATFWHFTKPTNHVPYSVLSRVAIGAWRAVVRPELAFVSEPIYRLPALAAGLASIALVALLLRRMGFARAGVLAAWILALHPWHLRYTTEARAYALLFAGIPGLLWLWLRAMEQGSWGRWIAFGAAEAALLWCWSGLIELLVLVNAAAVAGLVWLHWGTSHLRFQLARWAVVSAAAAMAWAQLMIPNLMQLAAYLGGQEFDAGSAFVRNVLAFLWGGITWDLGTAYGPHYLEVKDLAEARPGLFRAGVASTLALLALGTFRLSLARDPRALLAAVLLGAVPFTWLVVWWRADTSFEWYFVFALPLGAMLVALGLDGLFGWVPPRRAAVALTAAASLAWLGAFTWWTAAPRRLLRSTSVHPIRESVLLTRPTLDPFASENRRILTASFERGPAYYDPLHVSVDGTAGLVRLMREADASDRPLYVNLGRPRVAERRFPELSALVRRPEVFEELATFRGVDPRGWRIVYRYRPGGVEIPREGKGAPPPGPR